MTELIRAPLLQNVPGLIHGFSTNSLDLGVHGPPADWARLASALGAPPDAHFALARQVHGRTVLRATAPGPAGEGDALLTTTPGLFLVIRTADCVPVLLLGTDTVGVEIAAAHAGWRGIAAGILPATVAAMQAPPARAVIGPCISALRYEVGEEVVEAILGAGVPADVFVQRQHGPRPHADLRAAAAWQLRAAGVPHIEILPHCTVDDPRLHSHRRDGARSGRLAAVIGWRS